MASEKILNQKKKEVEALAEKFKKLFKKERF